MLMLGRQISLPADLEYGIPFHEKVQLCPGDYAKQLRARLQELHEITRETVRDCTFQTKLRHDLKPKPADFQPGDEVMLHNPKKHKGRARKLQTEWEGPYTIVQQLSEVLFQIRKTPHARIKTVHADRLNLARRTEPPLPVEFDYSNRLQKHAGPPEEED